MYFTINIHLQTPFVLTILETLCQLFMLQVVQTYKLSQMLLKFIQLDMKYNRYKLLWKKYCFIALPDKAEKECYFLEKSSMVKLCHCK